MNNFHQEENQNDILTSKIKSEQTVDHTIKEKLNLHLKKRKETFGADLSRRNEQKVTKKWVKKPKQKVSMVQGQNLLMSTEQSPGGFVGNPGSSVAPSCEQEKEEANCSIPDKKPKTPDILTMVLNEKKLSLMQDPEIKLFLENLTQFKRN